MNKFTSEKQTFKLQQIIEECLHEFHFNEKYRRIKLQRVDDLVEPLTLIGNKQVLLDTLELLMNTAAEYVGATSIMVSVKQLLQAEKEVLLEFAVTDNGGKILEEPGINLFTYKRQLTKARRVVEEGGGKADINSLYGVGTTFKFLLKFRKEAKTEAAQPTEKKLAGKRILVADDNELNQKIIEHLLKKEGMLVDIASDGREALDLYEKNRNYDLVLLDLQMPHVDGFQAANYMRKKLASQIPIIALTAGYYPDSDKRSLEVGFNQCIHKPLKPHTLLESLNHFLLEQPINT
ncbi:response regulator [Chitinophagaceae bacterium LB-8]|jgi:CheY-like chemotaxis protein|uniref:Response regulator n=1 Tax=Paraflavisolibacter caeni TaxID=2982496 RepID=A0A9X2XPM2_9BACT|nr:response regulator [Paraflavisolibacter caeni]MCU7551264.1 response regulator [Paraflavisolibacter caeni]